MIFCKILGIILNNKIETESDAKRLWNLEDVL